MKILSLVFALLLTVGTAAADEPNWVERIIGNGYRMNRNPSPRVVYSVPTPPLQPNGTYYTDEQLAESNKTRYNASGKQQVQRHVESWRSPLQRYENQPGVYSSGYLGPLPQGPVNGPYCPPGFNCWYDLYERRGGRGYRR